MSSLHAKPVAFWLALCSFMVFLMVVIGGLTRLTESGLSIVEWKPVSGIIPPLGEMAWQEEFAKYKQTPEYKLVNHGMNLEEFKSIFFLEYVHRLLGRLAGAVFLIPLLYFVWKRQLEKPVVRRLGVIFLLGGVQGVIGWYMVKSGLQHDPHVSHYRLALHLGTALVIEALLCWAMFHAWFGENTTKMQGRLHTLLVPVMVLFQSVTGAFVAGLHAGLIYNTFPLMDGRLVPKGMWIMEPWYSNIVENVTTVQFIHRLSALVLAALIISLWVRVQYYNYAPMLKKAVNFLITMLIIQVTLGIMTLLAHVPVALASLHQAGAVVLLVLSLYCLYRQTYPGKPHYEL